VSAGRSEGAASYGRGAALLSALIGVTGLFTYAFHSLAAHALGRDGYGLIAVLWAAVFLVASVIYRPVEQLLSRTLAERRAQGRPVGSALRVAATIQFGLVLAFLAVALALREPIEDELFSGNATLYWCLVVAGAAYAASYFARGFLAGEQRFGLYGGLVLMEAASRVVFGVLLIVGVLEGRDAAAIAIAAAPLLSLFVVPWALGRHVRRTAAPRPAGDPAEPEMTLAHGLGFAGAVLVIMVSEQAILNSGVLIVKAETGDDALAALIFAVLMIARAPLQLFQAVSTTLLPHLTRLLVRDGTGGGAPRGDFDRSVRLTVAACLAFGGVTVIGVLAVGPAVMRLLFGSEFDYDRLGLAMVAAGMGLYLSATTVNQAVLAQGRARLAAACWAATAVFFVAFLLLADMEEVREVEVAFLASAAMLAVLLYVVYRRPAAGQQPIEPGSTEEMGVILATADEGS
jgi:O-antigen/teichoic acid export membrane protein